MRGIRRVTWVWPIVIALGAAACSGGGGEQPTAAPSPTGAAQPSGAIASVDDVEQATVRITSEGAFRDPEIGQQQVAGSGSGFIIDPSGIAVTNNHVVTGGALFNVFVGTETEPRNARVLGVSECSDLAVIDIDGEGFPFLSWFDGQLDERLEVFAAGFPLGEPEFTITDGIVNATSRSADTNWTSVEAVIEHSARIRPGNSGGPLVTTDGRVVGVNYAGNESTDQNFAIAAAEARTLVEQLRGGQNVTSIGINGSAVDDGAGTTGIWIASVASGSPAQRAGVQSGDIITRLENVTLAEDGTLNDYCDILRSHDADDVLAVEVLRFDTQEVLRGQINGDQLETAVSFEQELGGTTTAGAPGEASYAEFVTITDDSGAISVSVPAEWSQVDGRPAQDDQGRRFADVRASSNLEQFENAWDTPGVIVSATSAITNELELIDPLVEPLSGQCTYAGRQPYSDPLYVGQFDTYENCGGVGASYIVVGARPEAGGQTIRVQVQVNSDRDLEALDQIISTFKVTGQV